MDIICHGARANTPEQSEIYRDRTLLVIQSERATIWIDCGATWRDTIESIKQQPDAIFITHAHDDHVGGLAGGSPAPVYASKETHDAIETYPIAQESKHIISPGKTVHIHDLKVTAHNVHHSTHAPAQAYRVATDTCTLIYSGDVAAFADPDTALSHVDIYIGDGSVVTKTMLLRSDNGKPVGHAPISHQLSWCHTHNISHAIFVHCGANIIRKTYNEAQQWVQELGREHDVYVELAYDGYHATCKKLCSASYT